MMTLSSPALANSPTRRSEYPFQPTLAFLTRGAVLYRRGLLRLNSTVIPSRTFRNASPIRSLAIAILILVAGCLDSQQAVPVEQDITHSVWTVDLVHTLPGQQAEYLRNIEANWAGARRIARERSAVLSYRALVAPPDSLRGWDVLLMTEYADSSAWSQREALFASIFSSPEYVQVPTSLPSSELREFASSGVVMEALVSEPRH